MEAKEMTQVTPARKQDFCPDSLPVLLQMAESELLRGAKTHLDPKDKDRTKQAAQKRQKKTCGQDRHTKQAWSSSPDSAVHFLTIVDRWVLQLLKKVSRWGLDIVFITIASMQRRWWIMKQTPPPLVLPGALLGSLPGGAVIPGEEAFCPGCVCWSGFQSNAGRWIGEGLGFYWKETALPPSCWSDGQTRAQ